MKPRMRNLALLPAVALIAVGPGRADGRLRLSITEGATSRSAPCSVFLTSPDGRPVRPPGLPFWNDHFATDGRSEFPLPAGLYRYELDRGPEFHVARGERVVRDGETATLSARLERIADLPAEGWWSGETHVHRNRAEIPLLMRTADLHL
ncbi:MAG: hypothetical protein KDM81_02445, partial [Verrucomicrobiae bacterium]|nr:hypothetical protein [Verrucomicrobiae bacterium]